MKYQQFSVNFLHKSIFVLLCGALSYTAVAEDYQRIVSTSGNVSEVIAEFGMADKLIAVDTTSTVPKDIMSKKKKIGYKRNLSSEGILSMTPDLVILSPDAGPQAVVEQLKNSGVNSITISDKKTLDGVVSDIELLADTLGAKAQSQPMIENIRSDEAEINAIAATYSRKPKIAFFMDGGIGRFMGLGKGTAGDGMIAISGAENVFAEQFNSVKSVSLESLAVTDIDMVIIAKHGGKDTFSPQLSSAANKYPQLMITKAGKNDCVFTVGIVEGLGFGPHLTTVAKDIANAAQRCTAQ